MKLPRRAIHFLLPVLLVISQHAAVAHLISHLDAQQPPAQEKTLGHLKLCDKCVSFAKLSHVASTAAVDIVAEAGDYCVPPFFCHARPSLSGWAYRSRAPPTFL